MKLLEGLKRRGVFRLASVYLVVGALLGGLGGCISDLPPEDFPCLVEKGLYDRNNEAYVFSPQGEKKREALARVQEAERECAASQ